jgi:hypothetical protein
MIRSIVLFAGLALVAASFKTAPTAASDKFKDKAAVMNTCVKKWEANKSRDNLSMCQAALNDAGNYGFLGNCSSKNKSGIATYQSGHCRLGLKLTCDINGNQKNAGVSCEGLIKAPAKLKYHNGKFLLPPPGHVNVTQGGNSSSSAKYKDYKAIQNACGQQWSAHEKDSNLATCEAQTSGSGNYIYLGGCSSAKKSGIATQESGKCQLNIQLHCKKRDQSLNDTQASCTTLLSDPSKFTNDDGVMKVK